jgi:Domain of unknown function (DUF4124)
MQEYVMRVVSGLMCMAGLMAMQAASAQVFKCTGADGKTAYSQVPCTTPDAKEKRISIAAPPPIDTPAPQPKDWAAENAAADARTKANVPAPSANSGKSSLPLKGLRPQPAASGRTDQQIIADCQANHGARCTSAAEINYRRQEQRTPTAAEQAAIQEAIRNRQEGQRQREMSRR